MLRCKLWVLQAFIGLCCIVDTLLAAKILFIPSPEYSHCNDMDALGQELIQRGHEVSMYVCQQTTIFRDCPGTQFEVIKFDWPAYEHSLNFEKEISRDIFSGRWKVSIKKLIKFKKLMCDMIQQDDAALQRLRDKKFDIAIIDSLFSTRCFFLIPYNLSIPFISVSSTLKELETGTMLSPNFVSNALMLFNTNANFKKRLTNTMRYIIFYLSELFSVRTEKFKLAPGLTALDVESLYQKSELFLDNSDIILDNPNTIYPYFRQVGGLTSRPGKPLPPYLLRFFNGAKHGVIIMSFGNEFENITDQLANLLILNLQHLPQRILVKTNRNATIGNIKMMTWFPLNDVCAHPKTKLVISHCGNNGFFESLYHGVPHVCMPVFDEQFQISSKIENYQMGCKLNVQKLNAETLPEAVESVLKDSMYRENAQKYSKAFRNRRWNPRKVAADSVEDVLQHGNSKEQDSLLNQPWYLQHNLDVWFCIHLVFLLAIIVLICTFYHIVKWMQYYKLLQTCAMVVPILYIHYVICSSTLQFDF
ncbi:2-hydroxyacylsphingosine 1-beta-galactosyltransferase [Argonauta hians]